MRNFILASLCCLLLITIAAGPARACTAFSFDTPGGPVFASNLDYSVPGDGLVFINRRGIAKVNFQQNTKGETLKWVSNYGSVTFNLAGYGFAWSGMNEAGLAMTMLELADSVYPEPDERAPFDIGAWVQYMLDSCGSVKCVIDLNSKIRWVNGGVPSNHVFIRDASGDSAGIEYHDGQLVVYTGKTMPILAMSNMFYAPALEAFDRGGLSWWSGVSNPGRSAERFAGAALHMKKFDPDAGINPINYASSILVHVVAMPDTKWSVVYDLAKRKVWFGTVASRKVKHLSLKSFELSCGSLLMMLDVNSPLEGNVEKAFIPFDHDINLSVFQNLTNRKDIEVSPRAAAELMRKFEKFQCAQ